MITKKPIKKGNQEQRGKLFYNLHYATGIVSSNNHSVPPLPIEGPLTIILRSFFRRIITHLVKDMEANTISTDDFLNIARSLRKILYQ